MAVGQADRADTRCNLMNTSCTRVGRAKLGVLLPAILLLDSTAVVAMQTPAAVNQERVLAALVDFVDVDPAERRFSKGDIEDLLVRNDDSLRSFMWETSRHTLQIDFDILDWVTVNKNRADVGSTHDEAISELSYFADLALYERVILFITPDEHGSPGCAADLAPRRYVTPNGVFDLAVAGLSGRDMGCVKKGRLTHEFGHTFGLLHSYEIDCVKDPPLPASLIDPGELNDSCYYHGCVNDATCTDTRPVESGVTANSDLDLTGGDSDERYEMYFPLHFQAIWQVLAGWLPENQVVTADGSGTYRVTTLERLDSQPKAVRISLGRDHRVDPVHYWLQTREFSPWTRWHPRHGTPANFNPCQVDVRLETSSVWGLEGRSRGYAHTYFFAGSGNELSGGQVVGRTREETTIRRNAPFRDPYRGVLVEMLECDADLDMRSTEISLSVQFTDLKLIPPIAAHYHRGHTTATMRLTNDGTAAVGVGAALLGGRHPAAFSIDADGCSDRTLGPGGTCEITVSYVVNGVDGIPDHHAILKIPNDDPLAPQLSVALFGER